MDYFDTLVMYLIRLKLKPSRSLEECDRITQERVKECDRITQERVKEHFKPKPKPEKVINPIDLKFFKGMCEANKRKFIPRYPLQTTNAQLSKLLRKKKRQSKSSSSDIPQLGAQKKQSIEPLVVDRRRNNKTLSHF